MAANNIIQQLGSLARVRQAHGDDRLRLNPNPQSIELSEIPDLLEGLVDQGLVLEPYEDAIFSIVDLKKRQQNVNISCFCDGIRSTYFVGYEDIYPLLYTCNAAAIRRRNENTGYHEFVGLKREQETLLAPFSMMASDIREVYRRLGMISTRQSDLCYFPLKEDEFGIPPNQLHSYSSQSWQVLGARRARLLLDHTEQIVALSGSRFLITQKPTEKNWILKDGSLSQFDRSYLKRPETIRNIVACVKTHPVAFFGPQGERQIAGMSLGQRSSAFLPRPLREVRQQPPSTLATTLRPMVSWYLRVHDPQPANSSMLSGVVRLDLAARPDWINWVDEISWAVLDEFSGISALPDSRYDIMPYGIYDCEQYLKASKLPGELLLANLV